MNNDELTAKHLAIHFQTGWNEALEKTAGIIDDSRYSIRYLWVKRGGE